MTEHGDAAYWRKVAVDALLTLQNGPDAAANPTPTPRPASPDWSVTERDIAFSMHLRDLLGLPASEARYGWAAALAGLWDGASPEEAFIFNLSFARNHGDGSDIPYLPDEELLGYLEISATRPTLTKWSARRITQLADEAKRRRLAS